MHRLRPLPLATPLPPYLQNTDQFADVLRKSGTTKDQKCFHRLDPVTVDDNGCGSALDPHFTAAPEDLKTNTTLAPGNLFFNWVYLLFREMIQIVGGTLIV